MNTRGSAIPGIEAYLAEFVRQLPFPTALRSAIEYALLGGGKRLRPQLAWDSCIAAGGNGEMSLPAGAAVELVHAFSLVHDDLPAMDDDDLRRGKPTLHIHAGEAMAILAGDAMLSLGFHVLAERAPEHIGICLCRELAGGTEGMIAGQVYDTLCGDGGGMPDGLSDRQRLELIHRNKTGALIRASCRMGAACAGALDESMEMRAISAYADAVGLMFQVVDDLLDVTQPAERIGKRANKDAQAGKLTYPGVLGVEGTRKAVQELREKAMNAIEGLGERGTGLRELAEKMARRES
ncbi:MAG: polyprenyl synthetase family protein [Phycisphaerales bacterium]|nr:polyprenyl synthetase family protein [Phycisphaerales bacterium]